MEYTQAMSLFLTQLEGVEQVAKLASLYGKDRAEVASRLRPYIVVTKTRSGMVKSMKIQMMERGSGIFVEHYTNFLTLK